MRRLWVGFDPGKVTGIAWWGEGWGETPPECSEQEFDGAGNALASLLLDPSGRPITVACERFTIGPETLRKSRENWSLELIGVARWLAGRHGADFVLQSPGDAKGLFDDDALRHLGWYSPSRGGHQNDALRHLGLARVMSGDRALSDALASR